MDSILNPSIFPEPNLEPTLTKMWKKVNYEFTYIVSTSPPVVMIAKNPISHLPLWKIVQPVRHSSVDVST